MVRLVQPANHQILVAVLVEIAHRQRRRHVRGVTHEQHLAAVHLARLRCRLRLRDVAIQVNARLGEIEAGNQVLAPVAIHVSDRQRRRRTSRRIHHQSAHAIERTCRAVVQVKPVRDAVVANHDVEAVVAVEIRHRQRRRRIRLRIQLHRRHANERIRRPVVQVDQVLLVAGNVVIAHNHVQLVVSIHVGQRQRGGRVGSGIQSHAADGVEGIRRTVVQIEQVRRAAASDQQVRLPVAIDIADRHRSGRRRQHAEILGQSVFVTRALVQEEVALQLRPAQVTDVNIRVDDRHADEGSRRQNERNLIHTDHHLLVHRFRAGVDLNLNLRRNNFDPRNIKYESRHRELRRHAQTINAKRAGAAANHHEVPHAVRDGQPQARDADRDDRLVIRSRTRCLEHAVRTGPFGLLNREVAGQGLAGYDEREARRLDAEELAQLVRVLEIQMRRAGRRCERLVHCARDRLHPHREAAGETDARHVEDDVAAELARDARRRQQEIAFTILNANKIPRPVTQRHIHIARGHPDDALWNRAGRGDLLEGEAAADALAQHVQGDTGSLDAHIRRAAGQHETGRYAGDDERFVHV